MKLKSCPITEGLCSKKCAWFDEDLKDCRVILALMSLAAPGVKVEVGR
jgi:hypothetical protein